MANQKTDGKLVVGIDIPRSKAVIEKDLDKLLSQIGSLEIRLANPNTDMLKKSIQEAIRDACKTAAGSGTSSGSGPWPSLVSSLVPGVVSVKDMYQSVKEINAAMTALRQSTREVNLNYQEFLTAAVKNAAELGRTVSSLIRQSAEWSSLGYSPDQAQALSKVSSVYANLAGIDEHTAVNDMTAAMKAFNIESEKAVTIIDPLCRLENEFSSSAKTLGTGLQQSAARMADSGADLYQTLAMLAGSSGFTQSKDTFGSFLETGAMRIRGMKEELEALGEEVDSSADSVRKVREQVLNLTRGQVDIFNGWGECRNYYDIMEDISRVYGSLSSSGQKSLSEILFGSPNSEQGNALIQAFQSGQIQAAYESAAGSAGSAYKAQSQWMDSMEARTKQFEASFQSLSNTILSSDLAKAFVDIGTSGVSALDKLLQLGPMGTATLAGGFLGAKNLGQQYRY